MKEMFKLINVALLMHDAVVASYFMALGIFWGSSSFVDPAFVLALL